MREYEKMFYGIQLLSEMQRIALKKIDDPFDESDLIIAKLNLINKAYATFSLKKIQILMKYLIEIQKDLYVNEKVLLPSYREMKNEIRKRMQFQL